MVAAVLKYADNILKCFGNALSIALASDPSGPVEFTCSCSSETVFPEHVRFLTNEGHHVESARIPNRFQKALGPNSLPFTGKLRHWTTTRTGEASRRAGDQLYHVGGLLAGHCAREPSRTNTPQRRSDGRELVPRVGREGGATVHFGGGILFLRYFHRFFFTGTVSSKAPKKPAMSSGRSSSQTCCSCWVRCVCS